MTLRLEDLGACFEGVIPSVVATGSSEGVPNISYLSHVVKVDENHVALSNQFFGKTSANLRAVPMATILLVDARTGGQFRVQALFLRSEESGPVFEKVAVQLAATSAQVGMANIMRLKAIDIFLVTGISRVPFDPCLEPQPDRERVSGMKAVARISAAIADAADLGGIVDAVLDGLVRELRCDAASLLLEDVPRSILTTIGTRGYGRTGIGSEVAFSEGVIGTAAAKGETIKISDLSRVRRFGAAIQAALDDEQRTRSIPLPGLDGVMSQIATPICIRKKTLGVVFVESRKRLAFGSDDEIFLEIIAREVGSAITLCEGTIAMEFASGSGTNTAQHNVATFRVAHHAFDDSVFIEDAYIIKGLAGRLLMFILETYHRDGRKDFSNREFRLSEAMRLPDFKDNLETRLLLLRRRLEEKQTAVRLKHIGRGQLRLEIAGTPLIRRT